MSTKQEPGPFDGFERAAPDEPVFTLRAHDPLAPQLVADWSDRKRKLIIQQSEDGLIDAKKRKLELLQCAAADEVSFDMIDWRKGAKEAPQQSQKPSYSGHKATDEELAAKAKFDALMRVDQLLQNARAAINDVADDLLLGLDRDLERAALYTIRDQVGVIADHLRPARGGEEAMGRINLYDLLSNSLSDARRLGTNLTTEAKNADPSGE